MTLTLMRNGTSGFHQTIDTFFNIFQAQDLKKSEMLAFVLLYYIYCEQALSKLSFFQVNMWAENKYGKSLKTYDVKVVTHLEGESAPGTPDILQTPALPDIKSCCISKNVSHPT